MPYDYPKLNTIKDYFELLKNQESHDFSSMVILACQHILETQKNMFQAIINLGFNSENIFVLGKIYSTSNEVLSEMQQMGINAVQPAHDSTKSFDQQHEQNCIGLVERAKDAIKNASRIIVLDDGGALLSVVNELSFEMPVVGIEQTSSGFRKLENRELGFPVYNVARSRIKLELETPYIVELGVARTKEKIKTHSIDKPKILVVGLGPDGLEMARALKAESFSVIEYDKIHGEQNLIKLIQVGINVVIGTTGSQILSHDELLELNNLSVEKLLMISMSSSDREFELWKMRDLFSHDAGIHDDVTFGNITIANNGFPITFRGQRIESLPKEMDRTMGLLLAGVFLGALNGSDARGLIEIPENILTLLE